MAILKRSKDYVQFYDFSGKFGLITVYSIK